MTFLKTLAATAAAALLTAGAVAADPIKVGVAAEPYPPFSSVNSAGEWEGWEIEIIKAVCDAAELECEITPTAWDGIIPALTGKQIDVSITYWHTVERRDGSFE